MAERLLEISDDQFLEALNEVCDQLYVVHLICS
jgi:hypothetical protein